MIISGRISTAVWYLAWPTIIGTVILMAHNLINRAFLGRLGNDSANALAAVGIGSALLNVQVAVMTGLSIGTAALVARFLGAGLHKDADEATRQSLLLSVIVGAIASIPYIIWAVPISDLMGAKSDVLPLASSYTAIIAWSSIPVFIYVTATAALRSTGDMINPLLVGAVVLILNAILDYFLIFGVGPFPNLGVSGAALATSISRVIGMILILWSLHQSVLRGSLKHLRIKICWFSRIMNIGIPAIIQAVPRTIAGVLLVAMIGGLENATTAVAALTLGYIIEDLAYMPSIAYSTAAVPLVGQNLGAGKPERAEKCAIIATKQAVLFMSFVAIFFLVIPKQLAMIFTNDLSVISLAAWYLILNAFCQPFLATDTVLRGALQGAGDVRVPAIISIITFCGIRLPLVWVFVYILHWGVISVWAAISGSAILSGILTYIWFRTGRWKSIEL